jgi:phage/conjugal plasmid C-4 type zinc finger TraR family protein
MINSEDLFASAEKNAASEREAMIAAATAKVSQTGRDQCVECERLIPADRREAAPFAVRCVECQQFHEIEKLHR